MCMGAHYLGVYIGEDKSERDWLRERTLPWEKNNSMIRKTAGKYSHESYAAVVSEIQSDCIFIQRITWYTGDSFMGVEKIIREKFLPCLFFKNTKRLSPIIGSLSTMPVNKSGTGLLNPVTSAREKYLSYQQGSVELVRDVTGGGTFYNADHLRTLSEERRDRKKDRDAA